MSQRERERERERETVGGREAQVVLEVMVIAQIPVVVVLVLALARVFVFEKQDSSTAGIKVGTMFVVVTIISAKFPAMGRVVEAVIDSSGRFALQA